MTTASAGGAIDVQKLATPELLNLLPTGKILKTRGEVVEATRNPLESAVLEELWARHYGELDKLLRASIFASGSTLCPLQEPDKELFHDEVITRTRDVLFRLTIRGDVTRQGTYTNFGSYLWRVALNKALDHRRELIAREPIVKPLEGKDLGAYTTPNDVVVGVRKIIQEYRRESPAKAASGKMVMLKEVEGWTWEELAGTLSDSRSLEARIQQVRRFVQKDEADLMVRLKDFAN